MIYTVTSAATGYLFFTRQLTYDGGALKFCSVRELPESKGSGKSVQAMERNLMRKLSLGAKPRG